MKTHAKPISKIKTTFDDNLIFTVGEDGVFIVYTINDNNSIIISKNNIY